MSGSGGGREGDGSEDGVIAWLTSDQLEEPEISEEKICQKSTCGEGSWVGLRPGWSQRHKSYRLTAHFRFELSSQPKAQLSCQRSECGYGGGTKELEMGG